MDGRASPTERPAGQHAANDSFGKRLEEMTSATSQWAHRRSPVGCCGQRGVITQSFQDAPGRTPLSSSILSSQTQASVVSRTSTESAMQGRWSVRCGRQWLGGAQHRRRVSGRWRSVARSPSDAVGHRGRPAKRCPPPTSGGGAPGRRSWRSPEEDRRDRARHRRVKEGDLVDARDRRSGKEVTFPQAGRYLRARDVG